LSSVTGLDVVDSDDLWFTNQKNTPKSGVLNRTKAKTATLNKEGITSVVLSDESAYAVSVSDDYAFFTTDTQLFMYDIDETEVQLLSFGFGAARGVSYGDDRVYVADHATGEVFKVKIDSDYGESEVDSWVQIEGAFGIHCINFGAQLFSALALMFLVS
jgi:hypothetical protein